MPNLSESFQQILNTVTQIRQASPNWNQEQILDYYRLKSDLFLSSEQIDEIFKRLDALKPQFGEVEPNGNITSNDSKVYYRQYILDTTQVSETYTNQQSGVNTGWIQSASFTDTI